MEIKDIENLAELAKIELTNTEKQGLLKDLDEILGYVKQIQEVKVPARPHDSSGAGGEDIELEYKNKNVWREDEIRPSVFSRDLIINQFPDSKDGFVKVKKIL